MLTKYLMKVAWGGKSLLWLTVLERKKCPLWRGKRGEESTKAAGRADAAARGT